MSATPPTERATEAIRARLLAGEDVAAAELAAVSAEDRLAAMKAATAAEAAENAAAAERRRRIAEVRDALPARLDPARVEKAAAKLATALDAYLAECVDLDEAHDLAAEVLRGLGPLPDGITVDSPHFGTIADDGRVYPRARPQTTIHRLTTEAIRRRYPRRQINLDNPQD